MVLVGRPIEGRRLLGVKKYTKPRIMSLSIGNNQGQGSILLYMKKEMDISYYFISSYFAFYLLT